MWFRKNKWKLIAPAAVVLILVAAFWYGGAAPGLRGWSAAPTKPLPEQQLQAQPGTGDEQGAGVQAADEPEETPDAGLPEPSPARDAHSGADDNSINPRTETGKEQFTDTAQEETPLPVEPENAVISDTEHTCTLSISCGAILEHMDWLEEEKVSLVPADGWILQSVETTFYEGESVFNVLQRTCKQNGIHMEFSNTPMYNSAYIEGIANLYEYDCGDLSGWMYKVNDWFPNYGCSRYALSDGDVVCWLYTCELGDDIGGYNALGD